MRNDELPEFASTAMGLVSLIHHSSFIIHHFLCCAGAGFPTILLTHGLAGGRRSRHAIRVERFKIEIKSVPPREDKLCPKRCKAFCITRFSSSLSWPSSLLSSSSSSGC